MKIHSHYGATESALEILKGVREQVEKAENWEKLVVSLVEFATLSLQKRPTSALLVNTFRSIFKDVKESYISNIPLDSFKEKFEKNLNNLEKRTVEVIEKLSEIGARRLPEDSTYLVHSYSTTVIKVLEKALHNGKIKEIYVTESRPGNEGYLVAKTLADMGIKVNLITDSAVNYFMNEIDLVLFGAEAITANGALVNKVGTSQIALSAYRKRTRVNVFAGTYKFSFETTLGERIRIPMLPADYIEPPSEFMNLKNITFSIPQMDVTPPEYIDAIVTEMGVTAPEGVPILLWEIYGEWIGKQPDILTLISELMKIVKRK